MGNLLKQTTLNQPNQRVFVPQLNLVIVLIGSVGSGKSTFVGTYLKDYTRINRDTLKTKEKCHAEAEKCMKL